MRMEQRVLIILNIIKILVPLIFNSACIVTNVLSLLIPNTKLNHFTLYNISVLVVTINVNINLSAAVFV